LCCAAAGLPGRGVACLAGYLPRALRPLPRGTPVFWSHGAQDERIPIGTARHGADQLRSSGALVDFCETQGGHKVGVECLRALRGWFVGLASDR
jgi:predicted esterase